MLTGPWSEAWVASCLYLLDPSDADRLLTRRVFGLLGHRTAPDAVPLVIHNFSSVDTGDGAPRPGLASDAASDGAPEAAGADPDDFVGVRCEVEFPIWRAGYCVTFDFAEGA
jgi:hypothetical protein